jgi:hypothetical protein
MTRDRCGSSRSVQTLDLRGVNAVSLADTIVAVRSKSVFSQFRDASPFMTRNFYAPVPSTQFAAVTAAAWYAVCILI